MDGSNRSPSSRPDVVERLKQRVLENIFPQLAQGFAHDRRCRLGVQRQLTEEELHATYEATLTFLYRLLFLLYAESRELLPIRETVYAAVSLTRLKAEIAERAGEANYSLNETTLYDRLLRLFTALERGDPALSLPALGGGLFAGEAARASSRQQAAARFLCEHKVPDRYLALAIDSLAREMDDRTDTLISIDYQSLSVRHLGSIYEVLLGCKLRVAETPKSKRVKEANVAIRKEDVDLARDKSDRKASGSYYTPDAIVKHIVASTFGPVLDEKLASLRADKRDLPLYDRLFDFRVLDPAMGTGHFLVEAVNFITDRLLSFSNEFPENSRNFLLDRTRLQRHVLQRCIYGVDLDPFAAELAKISLWLEVRAAGEPLTILDDHLRCGNSLIGAKFQELQDFDNLAAHFSLVETEPPTAREPRQRFFHWQLEFPDVMAGFDCIVGNPPYLSYSGRQGERLEHRSYFDAAYGVDRWPTLHGLFMKRAIQLSRDAVSFVVPDQVGHLDGYGDTRAYLTEHANLEQVRYWGEDVFADAVTPSLTFITRRTRSTATLIEAADGTVQRVKLQGSARWSPPSEFAAILEKLRRHSASLGEWVGDPGVHTGNCSQQLIVPLDSSSDVVPILEGKQVSRYGCGRPAVGLRTGYQRSGEDYFTIRPLTTYRAARFVIRQTAAYPIVGPRQHADYFRNSLLALFDPETGVDVHYLVGLLNSRLLRFAYQQTVQESAQKAFPQVKVRTLRSLPIRLPGASPLERQRHDELVALVSEMLIVKEQSSDHAALDERIDRVVYSIYELTESETQKIEHWLASTWSRPKGSAASA